MLSDMFAREIYMRRRERLKARIGTGVILLPGNDESPMNYSNNTYPFRQDSSFLYYFGLDESNLAAVIDLDEGTECIFGDDLTVEQVVWTGPQPLLRTKCERAGVANSAPSKELESTLQKATRKGCPIHFLPQYRPENVLKLAHLLGIPVTEIGSRVSVPLIQAVVAQRSIKSPEEIEQIEAGLEVSYRMQTTAMKMARPGMVEREVAGAMAAIAIGSGVQLAFATIFSIHGETLHNPYYGNTLKAGDIAVNDSGAESPLRYASDITRTVPIGGRFTTRQREVYAIVLDAQEKAITAIKPGVEFRSIHRLAARTLVAGLKELGLVRGDPDEAVEAGVHTLFFQCGVGHMMGLDVHDMEALGEDFVGYTDTIKRNPAFGWRSLRMAKAVEPGHVVTVEPGIYMIPQLIDQWKTQRKCESFVNYSQVDAYRDFGGIRIEDDILVASDGCRVLGRPIPKKIDEVESLASA
jgi:Xaa-Pro aminopeptidase